MKGKTLKRQKRHTIKTPKAIKQIALGKTDLKVEKADFDELLLAMTGDKVDK